MVNAGKDCKVVDSRRCGLCERAAPHSHREAVKGDPAPAVQKPCAEEVQAVSAWSHSLCMLLHSSLVLKHVQTGPILAALDIVHRW